MTEVIRHRLTDIDREAATAVCSVCGPTRIRVRSVAKGCECWTVVQRYTGRQNVRRNAAYTPRPKVPSTPDEVRRWFLRRVVVVEGGCWQWTGAIDRYGYGKARMGRRHHYIAHRLGYELLVGPIPDGLTLDHLCHTRACPGGVTCPHRRCVNPEHLRPATLAENARRGHQGRSVIRTHCKYGHQKTISRNGNIYCRECARQRTKECAQRQQAKQDGPASLLLPMATEQSGAA